MPSTFGFGGLGLVYFWRGEPAPGQDPGDPPTPPAGIQNEFAETTGWVERWGRNFAELGAISLNRGQSEQAILADTGEYKPAGMRYREGAQQDRAANQLSSALYNSAGIPGHGFDSALDPFYPGISAEFIKKRPTGEIEPKPGIGIRLHSRAPVGPSHLAQLESVPYGNKPYADAVKPTAQPLLSSGYITTFIKGEMRPPFATYSKCILRNSYAEHSFGAPDWRVEGRNFSWNQDRAHSPFEQDSLEQLGWGANGNALTASIHAFNNRANVINGANPVITIAHEWLGGTSGYDPGTDPLLNVPIETYTCFEANGDVWVAYRVNGGAWYRLPKSDVGRRVVSGVTAEYDQYHMAFIHNSAGGHTWITDGTNNANNRTAYPTIPLALDIQEVKVFLPDNNPNYVLPQLEAVPYIQVNWTPGPSRPEDVAPHTIVADVILPTGVTSVNYVGYIPPGKAAPFYVDVATSKLKVGADGLDFETHPEIIFALEGVKPSGAKSVGPWNTFTVTDVVEDAPTYPAWLPVRGDGVAPLYYHNLATGKCWYNGAEVADVNTQITALSPGYDVDNASGLEAALTRTAKTEVFRIDGTGTGVPWINDGYNNRAIILSGNGMYSMDNLDLDDSNSFSVAFDDNTRASADLGTGLDFLNGSSVYIGVTGAAGLTRLKAEAGAVNSVNKTRASIGTDQRFGRAYPWADNQLMGSVVEYICYADDVPLSAAALSALIDGF